MKKNGKIFLLICLGLAFAADFSVTVFLLVGGIQGQFWLFPLVFALLDLAFIVQAVFSNFRFKYTVAQIVGYLILSVIALGIMLWADVFPGGETYFTDGAAALWFVLHFAGLITSLVCYLRASNFLRGKAGAAVASLFIIVCAACTGYYGVTLAATGFLGQGPETAVRPLSYEYDEATDSYAVKRVLNGRGTSVTVPAEFNGKKITKISSSVFYAAGLTDVTLNCEPTVEITDNFAAEEGLTVHTPRENADAFRSNFFGGGRYALANAVTPYDLDGDEVFVTFSYDKEAYEAADGKFLPTYITKKGSAFDLGYFKDIPYATHADRRSDGDLYWCSTQNGGKILSPLKLDDGGELDGAALNKNAAKIKVEFENVYKVYPVSDGFSSSYVNNDDKYELAEHFGYSEVNGAALDYKLTVAQYADEILSSVTRKGFDLEWWYANGSRTGQYSRCESLSELFERGLPYDTPLHTPDYVTIAPHWELQAPTVTIATDCANDTVVYGEDIGFTVSAQSPVDDGVMTYNWEYLNEYDQYIDLKNYTDGYSIVNFIDSQIGEYFCTVMLKAECTSLTSNRTASVDVKMAPRPLTLKWTYPANDVYDGTEKEIKCEIVDGIINEDNVSLFYNTTNFFKYAGKYSLSVGLQSEGRGRYTFGNESSVSYEIRKAPLDFTFTEVETVYNGKDQSPAYTVSGECQTDTVVFAPVSARNAAGTYDYAYMLGSDKVSSSYYLASCSSPSECSFDDIRAITRYTIKPYGVNVNWTVYDVTTGTQDRFTYDGKSHTVNATALGVDGAYAQIDINLAAVRNAGTHNLTATSRSSNYEIISGGTKTLIIDKHSSAPLFENTTLTYNGGLQSPQAYIRGVGTDSSRITVAGTGAAKNVGTYTYTAASPSNDNYALTGECSREYKINPYTIRISWSDNRFIYDGKPHLPKATAQGLGSDGELSFTVEYVLGGAPVNSGNYTCRATITDGANYLAKNYTIDTNGDTTQLHIDRATLNVNPDDYVMRAGDSFVNIEDKFTFTVTGFVGDDKQSDFDFGSVEIAIVGYSGGSLAAGTYELRAQTPSGTQDQPLSGSNYVMHFGTGTLTVVS